MPVLDALDLAEIRVHIRVPRWVFREAKRAFVRARAVDEGLTWDEFCARALEHETGEAISVYPETTKEGSR